MILLLYQDFKSLAKKQDARNRFENCSIEGVKIPEELIDFYEQCNPTDVEIVMQDLTSIKFFPIDYLDTLQSEYGFTKDHFVFASREGDPILLKNRKVYTAVHGSGTWVIERIFDSFVDFIKNLVEEMNKKIEKKQLID